MTKRDSRLHSSSTWSQCHKHSISSSAPILPLLHFACEPNLLLILPDWIIISLWYCVSNNDYFRPATLDSLIITEYSCSKQAVRWMNHMHISLGDVIFALKSLTTEIVAIDSIWQCVESLEGEFTNKPSWWFREELV